MQPQQKKFLGLGIWFLASFFYAYQYILRVLPNVMWSDIMHKFDMNAQMLGQLNGIYYIGYALAHIPVGLLLDKYGPKKVLPVCMLMTCVGLLPFVYSDLWLFPCAGRFLIGIGSSAAILGVFKILRMAFAEQKFTRMLGFSVTIGLMGAIYGGRPLQWLIDVQGWEMTFKILSGLGLLLAVMTYFLVPNQSSKQISLWQDLISVCKQYKIMTICLLAGLMVGPLEGFADGWSTAFLQAVYGLEPAVAASLPAMIFIGMCLGASILSLIAEKTQKYFQLIALCGLTMAAIFIGLMSGRLHASILAAGLCVIGVACAYQILAIYKATTYIHESAHGVTTAFANMIIMLFGYLFHSGIGLMMTRVWSGQTLAGVPVYKPHEFAWALSLLPCTLIIGALGFSLFAWKEVKATKVSLPSNSMTLSSSS